MKALFFNVLSASFYGSVVIAAVLLLRLVLKKAPRAAICLLWLLAGIRLVLPFTIESRLSLQPAAESIAQIRQEMVSDAQSGDSSLEGLPVQSQGSQVPAIPQQSEGQETQLPGDVQIFVSDDAVTDHEQRVVDYGTLAAWVWAAGIVGLLVYSTWSYWRLRRRVREAVRQVDGSWECPGLDTAFVLGFLRPRIYLPGGIPDRDRELILAHEWAHIARKDHWIKPVGYLILMLHWFNPLVWLAYVCLCRDIEMACDERVVKNMDVADRKEYSRALLNCGSRGIGIAACPVAFGEVGVKQRILGVLHYRKPGFWIVTAAAAAVVFVVVCLMTGPAGQSDSPLDPENAGQMLEGRTTVIAVEYRQNINGSISVRRADGAQVAEALQDAHFRSWLVSDSHGDFTAYVDIELLEDLSLRVFDNGHADVIRGKEIRHYGAPKGLYDRLHALMQPANSEDVITAAAEMGAAVWNLNMTVDNLGPTGLRLSFTQSGRFPGSATGSLRFGADYSLECMGLDGWMPVEKLHGDEPTVWPTVAYLISLDGTVSHDVDWSWLYGELAPGRYRIIKDVSLDLPNQESLNADFYAEFYLGGEGYGFSGASGDTWGLSLEGLDVTSAGMTLVCTQQGEPSGEIITGEEFTLYARKGQGWVPVPMVTRDVVWNEIAWLVNQNGQTQWTLDWEWLYGKLPQGEYVLQKVFHREEETMLLSMTFAVGETIASQWEELSALELCKRALLDFQSRESGYVTWENSFGTNGVTQSRVTGEYWFAGENWLRKAIPLSGMTSWYLGSGSQVYQSYGDEMGEWFAVGNQGAEGLRPWIYGLEWDEQKISLLYDEWVDEERQITLAVQGTPPAVIDDSVTQYQVTFRFDREGRLLSTGHAYLEPGGDVDTMVVSTMNILDPSGDSPEQVVADAMKPLRLEEARYLERCRDALAEFQKGDSYHVTQLDFYAGNALNVSATKDYWKSGEDWLHTVTLKDVDNGRIVYRLKKDGIEYQQELYDTLTDNPQGWPWSAAENASDCMDGNWLGVFNWENSMIEYVSTDIMGDNQEVVTVTVKEDQSAFGKYCPYVVKLSFDSDGILRSAALTLEENKWEKDWSIINSIYNIDDTEDAQIRAVIEAEAMEAILRIKDRESK